MHNIGNETDARTILDWVRSFSSDYSRPDCVRREQAPEGWEFVGAGSFRSVWRSPEGVAYKVEHDAGYSSQSTEEIYKLGQAWEAGAPEGCRIPKFDAFYPYDEIVIAIELIKGVTLYEYDCAGREGRDRLYELLNDCEDRFRLCDLHDENAIVDEEGYLVPVDFGG